MERAREAWEGAGLAAQEMQNSVDGAWVASVERRESVSPGSPIGDVAAGGRRSEAEAAQGQGQAGDSLGLGGKGGPVIGDA